MPLLNRWGITLPAPHPPNPQIPNPNFKTPPPDPQLPTQDFSARLEKKFEYFPEPKVTSVSPPGGPAESSGMAFVKGSGFLNTSYVKCRVGTVISQGIWMNSTFVKCTIPQAQPKVYSTAVLSLGVVTLSSKP